MKEKCAWCHKTWSIPYREDKLCCSERCRRRFNEMFTIGSEHPVFGEIVMCHCESEPMRTFKSKDGSYSDIPLAVLKEENIINV